MNIFKLEDYLTQYEFSAPFLLCCSDVESFSMQEIIDLANNEDKLLWNNLRLTYTETWGLPALREQIAYELYPPLTANNILCFAGAEEGIFASLYTLCQPQDHAIVLTPCYQSLLEIPLLKEAQVTKLDLEERNEWRIDLDTIKKAIRPNTKLIVINFPHNPTGQVITPDEINGLIKLCKEHDLWLFSDEVYRLLGQPKQGWAQPAACIYPKAISLGVMSKAFGMAGLRVGWIVCQNTELLTKIKHMKDYLSICNSGPSEILSLIALKKKDLILERNNAIVKKNLQLLTIFMEKYKTLFSWIKPQGGCIGFVEYKGHQPIDQFCTRLVKETGVLLLPASIYNHNSNHFRIGFGRKNMPEALNKFEEFLDKNT